jgi:CBS domain-containing protein
MKCEDVMLTLVFKCDPESTVSECAQLMRDEQLGFVPVLDKQMQVVGVVTDRDLAVRVLAEDKPGTTRVSEVMSMGPFLSCEPEDDLHELELRMAREKKTRALVKASDGSLLGVISLSDIAQNERSAARTGRLLKEVTRRESVSLVRQ